MNPADDPRLNRPMTRADVEQFYRDYTPDTTPDYGRPPATLREWTSIFAHVPHEYLGQSANGRPIPGSSLERWMQRHRLLEHLNPNTEETQ